MVVLAVLALAAVVGYTWELSRFIAKVFGSAGATETADSPLVSSTGLPEGTNTLLIFVLVFGTCRASLLWLQDWLSSRAAAVAKRQLRTSLLGAIGRLGPAWLAKRNSAEVALLATSQLDALDAYFGKFLPQLVYSIIVTPVLTALIFATDVWSGIAILCTLPLIPLFMIFIGWATNKVQQEQLDAMNRLARHFYEVLRGLTTLRVFGRLPQQPDFIAASSENYRRRTMRVLRVSFLSGFALEVAASLSVALIAVSIGLRLIDGSLELSTGLFVLLLAPEAYLPIRLVGANFHASNEGVVASGKILDVLDAAEALPPTAAESTLTSESLERFDKGKITRITGVSGAGKTKAMARLRSALPAETVAWLPQQASLFPGTISENVAGPGQNIDAPLLEKSLALAALDDVSADSPVGDATTMLSGGQAQRVALARAFYRALGKDCEWLLLDEPIAALDAVRAEKIASAIRSFASQGKRVVVISHQHVGPVDNQLAVTDV